MMFPWSGCCCRSVPDGLVAGQRRRQPVRHLEPGRQAPLPHPRPPDADEDHCCEENTLNSALFQEFLFCGFYSLGKTHISDAKITLSTQ